MTYYSVTECFFSCYSSVGVDGDKEQIISIGDGCEDHGTVVHEIGKYQCVNRNCLDR